MAYFRSEYFNSLHVMFKLSAIELQSCTSSKNQFAIHAKQPSCVKNVAFLVFCYLFKTHGMPTGLSYFRTDCRLSIKLVTQFSEALSLIYQHLLLWKKDFCLIRFSKAWLELHFFPPTKINTDHHGPSRKKKRVVSIGPRLMVLDFFGHRKWIASI